VIHRLEWNLTRFCIRCISLRKRNSTVFSIVNGFKYRAVVRTLLTSVQNPTSYAIFPRWTMSREDIHIYPVDRTRRRRLFEPVLPPLYNLRRGTGSTRRAGLTLQPDQLYR